MKKILLAAAALAVLASLSAEAAVTQGKVNGVQGAMIMVQNGDGVVQTFQVSDDTIYRAKKVMKEDKNRNGKMLKKGEAYFMPMVEEDDWVELTYTPSSGDLDTAEISEVIVYEN